MKVPVYLIEKATGHVDENGVKLFYTFAGRLTRAAAERDYETEIQNGARVRKIIVTK